mmetsp:Transcript_5072/g.6597  ORF Transcript_5072/g.6597 Transcript_5072/m.6597 type:complete len:240 (-) Transcript_5072:1207-1926(-)
MYCFLEKETDMNQSDKELFGRMGCRLILLPSGSKLYCPLETPSGGVTYGTLLYGGIKRYRLLSSNNSNRQPRRVGEKIEIMSSSSSADANRKAWLQFGGPLRMYEAIDMGPACILEVSILPSQTYMIPLVDLENNYYLEPKNRENFVDMVSLRFGWGAHFMFQHEEERKQHGYTTEEERHNKSQQRHYNADDNSLKNVIMGFYGKDQNDAVKSGFQSTLGGLDREIDAIGKFVIIVSFM